MGMTPAGRRAPAQEADVKETAAALASEVERLSGRVARLEEEKAALTGFIAVAAHELVVPLVMVESYAAMLSDRLEGEEHADSREDLDTLARGSARTRLMIETLLSEARSTERPLRRRPVDLNEVVGHCVMLLGPEFSARGAQVEVGELPEVLGEEALLSGVFVNLLSNALKYSPRRGGSIRIDAAREPAHWRLRVHSDGVAIPVEDQERIFEPFHRGRAERRAKGAGLGLAICRRIIERHGGTIGVSSPTGMGNAFFFTLPAR
jgi:chemotaxis family two-component system sensor kinase Cph1